MSRALYRAYRSRTFDEVVGQRHVTDLLDTAIKSEKIAHAYLLTGPRGVGKTSVARIIAHAVNKLEYSEDQHLDIIEIDAASNRRIDDIRDLREKVHVAPVSATYKVYIIDEVHMLTGESFNALLKTLEEPPEHVIFILATTEVHKLPATIVSRTQRFHFRPAKKDELIEHLRSIATKESIDVTDDALMLIALHANGGFRDALSLLDQLSGIGETVTAELVESVLGMASRDSVRKIITALESGDATTIIAELDALNDAGISAVVLTDQLTMALREEARMKPVLYGVLDSLIEVAKAHDPALKLTAILVKACQPSDAPRKTIATAAQKPRSVAKKPSELRSELESTPPPIPELPSEMLPEASSDFSWEGTLAVVKKHYPPLHSVLMRADVNYDESAQQLTLVFHYALHRKKLENPQYRKQLGSVIQNTFGFEPELIITDKLSQPLGGDASVIAAIMGGGELVSGTA